MKLGTRVKLASKILLKGVTLNGVLGSLSNGGLFPRDFTPSAAIGAVTTSALIGRCIGQWLMSYPQAPLVQRDRKGAIIYDGTLSLILDGDGGGMPERQLKRLKMFYQLLTGTAYLINVRNERGAVVGWDVSHDLAMRPIREGLTLTRWERSRSDGSVVAYAPEDVLPMPWVVPNPSDPMRGVSPLQACFTDHSTRQEVKYFVYHFLRNGAVPGTVISFPDGLAGGDDAERSKADFELKFGGENRGKTLFYDGPVDVKTFAHGLKDLNIGSLNEGPEADICAAFMMPPQLVDALVGIKNGRYDTDTASVRKFVKIAVAGIWADEAMAITNWLVSNQVIRPGEDVIFDISDVVEMQEEADKLSVRVLAQFQANIIPREVAQALLGYDPTQMKGAYLVDITRAMQPQPAPTKGLKAYGDDSDDERATVARWKSIDEEIAPLRSRLEKSLGRAFEALREEVTGKSLAGNDVRVKRLDPTKLTSEEIRKRLLDATEEDRTALTVELIERAVRDADIDMDTVTSWLTEARRATAAESVASLTRSADTVASEIADIIKANPNATRNELIDLLGDHIATVGASRVATIATTTATQTNSTAQNEAWEAINKRRRDRKRVESRWLTQRDGKVRDSHAAADGSKKDKDGFYTVGGTKMKGPGLGTAVEEIVNCRCVQVPEIIKE